MPEQAHLAPPQCPCMSPQPPQQKDVTIPVPHTRACAWLEAGSDGRRHRHRGVPPWQGGAQGQGRLSRRRPPPGRPPGRRSWHKFIRLYYIDEVICNDATLQVRITMTVDRDLLLRFDDERTCAP